MNSPQVTLVVSPRERFSYSRESLDSIYAHTDTPFDLIYIDGNSPVNVQRYLTEQSQVKGFTLIRTEQYLSPNQARNLAIVQVKTPYVVFVDNDIAVTSGWLNQLLQCAQGTDAAVVCPLTCIGQPLHQTIHLAGGEAHIETFQKPGKTKTKRRVHEKHYFVNRPVAEVQDQLQRQQCEFAEFHCMLVRTDIFNHIGLLDEALLSTREHIDFCMAVANAGGKIYCEPASVVTYVPGGLEWSDLPFFMLRWSDAWELASLEHFRKKWNVTEDKYFQKRYRRLGQRRHQGYLRPFVRRLSFGQRPQWLEQWLIAADRRINRYLSDRYSPSV
ncbi:MAG: glycosyltransferase [Thermosynechococcaceae cyanobacterium MS004]|nr:glycosyltransferase [Thermosynechococcaceae cyanobacterium MS004]